MTTLFSGKMMPTEVVTARPSCCCQSWSNLTGLKEWFVALGAITSTPVLFHKDQPFPSLFPKEEKLLHRLFIKLPESAEKVEWSLTVAEYVGCHEQFIEQLLLLGPVSKLRIIYWFNC